MPTNIQKDDSVVKVETVTFTKARVKDVILPANREDRAVRRLYSDEHDFTTDEVVELDEILDNKTVQQAIDDWEAYTGQMFDPATISVRDFLHSIIHEIARQG